MGVENIALVDENDNQIGFEEKILTHKKGLLHRAFSIFVFNSKGELLLQKRNKEKYHSGGLWTNTCCSHQREDEKLIEAAHRRLNEEMGFDCELNEQFVFKYKTTFKDLFENEIDHVLIGKYDKSPKPNPDEVEDWKWANIEELKEDVEKNPDSYTYWFKIALKRIKNHNFGR